MLADSQTMPNLIKTFRHSLCGLVALMSADTVIAAEQAEPLKVYDKWGGEFTLTDHHGIPISLSDFKGKVVLLNFGYTHCPDICPTTMFTLKRVIKALDEDADKVQVLFITLDPERDHPDRLQTYMEYFNPGFVALSGTVDQIKHVADKYGMRFEKEGFDEEGNYSIAHAAVVYLLDQAGRIRVFFKTTAPASRIAEDVKKLLAE